MAEHEPSPTAFTLRFWQKLVLISGICMVLLAAGLMSVNYWSLQRAGRRIGGQGEAMLEETNRRFLAAIVIGQADTIDHQLELAMAAARMGAQTIESELSAGEPLDDGLFRLLLDSAGPYATAVYYLPREAAAGVAAAGIAGADAGAAATVFVRGSGGAASRLAAPDKAADAPPPDGLPAWTAVHTNPHSAAYDRVIDAVAPIFLNGRYGGVLGVSVSVIRLTAQFSHRQAIRGSYNFLIDTGQRLLACPPLALVDLQPTGLAPSPRGIIDLSDIDNAPLQRALHAMAYGNEAVERVFFPEGDKYVAYRPLGHADLRLGLVVPVALASITTRQLTAAIAERSRSAMAEMLALSLLLLGITLVLVALVSRKMSRPLKEIAAAADRISHGRLDQLIPVTSRDEIGVLADSFNTMSRRLKAYVDDLRRQQALLAKSESQYRLLFDNTPSILIGVDAEGTITQWNQMAAEAAGVSVDDAVGRPLEQVFPPLAGAMTWVAESLRTGREGFYPKLKRETLEGELRYEDLTIYPLGDVAGGGVIRADDITERLRLEEMLIQNEKMLSVGGLAAGMAHEINNPLAGIMQSASVLSNRLGGHLDLEANHRAAEAAGTTLAAIQSFMQARGVPEMLTTIHTSGQRMADIVSNMLSFARRSEDVFSAHQLDALMDKTLSLAATDYDMKRQYDFRQIEIVRRYGTGLPAVICEAAKIQQVLLNILRNGAQAMQAAGTSAPRLTITIHHDPVREFVRIDIEDNGPGMDEKTRKRVFEPFFTTKPEGTGTGLGLSVSYFIITDNHDGEMSVQAHPGQGATFTIGLPVGGPQPEPAA